MHTDSLHLIADVCRVSTEFALSPHAPSLLCLLSDAGRRRWPEAASPSADRSRDRGSDRFEMKSAAEVHAGWERLGLGDAEVEVPTAAVPTGSHSQLSASRFPSSQPILYNTMHAPGCRASAEVIAGCAMWCLITFGIVTLM